MSSEAASPRRAPPAWPRIPAWTTSEGIFLAAMLVLAVFLRVVALDQVPPGMQHDEVFDSRFATLIRDGARPVFFDENAGVAPLFMYCVAIAFRLLGQTVWALRLTSMALGVAGLLVAYLLLRELFGRRPAQIALAGLTISFWHLFDSRVGLEPITIPVLAGLAFYAFWRALRSASFLWYIIAGVCMALASYGYHSGPLVPIAPAVFVIYLALFRPGWLRGEDGTLPMRRAVVGVAAMFLVAALVLLPLALHVLGNAADSGERVRTLSHHMTLLLAGQPGPILSDIAGVLGMFFVRGDPEWRYNVAGRPVFDPISGALFLLGLGLCLRRLRQPEVVFLLLWLPINLIFSAITPPSSSSLRALGSIAPIYALPAIGLAALWEWTQGPGRRGYRIALAGLAVALFAGNLAWTVRDYFFIWPRHPIVRAVYRADLAAAARYLDAQQPAGAVLISAQFAADLDQQTFDYMLRRKRFVKWFDGRRAFPIPTQNGEQPTSYLFPATNPAPPATLRRLEALEPAVTILPDPTGAPAVTIYHLTTEQMARLRAIAPDQPLNVNLANEIDLLGYELPKHVPAGEGIPLTLFWRVRRGGRGDLTYVFFAHILDPRDFRWAQDDSIGFPTHSWQAGDLVAQYLHPRIPADAPPAQHDVVIGVYEQHTGARLIAAGSGEHALRLRPIMVVPGNRPVAPGELHFRERVNARFGDRLTLLGYDIPDRILNLEEKIEVGLTWRAEVAGAPDIVVELTLTGATGQTLPPIRRQLVDGQYVLEQLPAGGVVRDRFRLAHTTDIPRGLYDIELAVLDGASGQRLPIAGGGETVSLSKVFMRGLP